MKSKFVSGLGWLTLLLSALMGVGGIAEFLISGMIAAQPEAAEGIAAALSAQAGTMIDAAGLPAMMQGQALTHGVIAVIGAVSGVGLLKRREWARRLTLGMVIFVTLATIPYLFNGALPPGISRGVAVAFFVLIVILHGDIVRRLMSPAVREEFGGSRSR